MIRKVRKSLGITILFTVSAFCGLSRIEAQTQVPANIALINGRWFTGKSFEPRTLYSVTGVLTFKKPARVDRTLDLSGTWIVPPFAEAHNHNIDGASEERSRKAIQKYLADGVFYVKIQGNFPLGDEAKRRLAINRPDGIDVALAQTFITATGGHPVFLHENVLLSQGYYPGLTKDDLRNKLYFTVDSHEDLERKWPLILQVRPDFIKANLWCSDEFEKRKDDPAYLGRKALDPRLLPKIVAKAHASKLRVSVHVTNAADFHHAVAAGVDEIAHSGGPGLFKMLEERGSDPRFMSNAEAVVKLISEALQAPNQDYIPISADDAKLAAKRGIIVVTTLGLITRSPEAVRVAVKPVMAANLKLLHKNGVRLAVGSDNVSDSSVREFEGLHWLGVFDNLTLLRIWTETTPTTIFPQRKIGAFKEGYEASFLALEGNPLEDIQNVRKIKVRFKQGVFLEP